MRLSSLIVTILGVLALSGCVLGQAVPRNPNPCAGKTDASSFVNDYASCPSYFWCNLEQAFPAPPCQEGRSFDEALQGCTADAACVECPATGTITVADPTDTTCTTFVFCTEGVRGNTTSTCGEGTRFNRVTGVCDRAENVICPDGVPPSIDASACMDDSEPPVGITGDVNSPTACADFIQCIEGVPSPIIFSCGQLHFNPATGTCDLPSRLIPPCVDARSAGLAHMHILSAPNVERRSLRQRIMDKLHL